MKSSIYKNMFKLCLFQDKNVEIVLTEDEINVCGFLWLAKLIISFY